MAPQAFRNNSHSAIYNKALEIFSLSRNIATYIGHDLAHLQRNGQEDPGIYFTGDIVQQSISLGPQILKAESGKFSEEKHKYAASVMRLSNLLYKNCERLERVNSNGKDFLPLLRKELKRFRKLQHTWRLTL
ncbi:MAG: hypothetical protein CL524_09470 [Aequorivita sp.]|jgi:hypothetical protein|uniref:Four helix bundle protein n=1 Tax=Aequorivita aquimaris TaxID=1548749 RepID=A0A137RGW4_9FLAO|nr:hypothetical protein [Aequorivita aquimaris]KXN98738.1 hypothetical protein LS48_09260 [Aequorivita aquimaris]MAB57758.1 hypothetical protein [Aequorivita sp.]MBF29755.1 hypothetical protein [Aequorivita sp.]|tara:strand:+ start:56914 stop:57309 length:396 start_codon:yes stop_codon:yes gene_type:complete